MSNLREKVNQQKKDLLRNQQAYQYEHNHKDAKGYVVKKLSDASNKFIIQKPWMDKNTTYYCEECGAIFDSTPVTKEEIGKLIYNVRSALHQFKLFVDLDDEEIEEIVDLFEGTDKLENFLNRAYNKMIDNLTNANKNDNKKRGAAKAMFGTTYGR